MTAEVLQGVYAIRAHGLPFVKIGYSKNARKRLNEIQTGCPARVFLHAYLPGATEADEKALHRKLRPWQTSGEWFAWEDPVREEIHKFTRIQDTAHTKKCQQEADIVVATRGETRELREKLRQYEEMARDLFVLIRQEVDDGSGRHPWTARKELAKMVREVECSNWKLLKDYAERDDPKEAVQKLLYQYKTFCKAISKAAGEHFDAADMRQVKMTEKMIEMQQLME
jgi:hypothetical protein